MIRYALLFAAGSLGFFVAGFVWTLGGDAARAVIVKRTAQLARRKTAAPTVVAIRPRPRLPEPEIIYYAPQTAALTAHH